MLLKPNDNFEDRALRICWLTMLALVVATVATQIAYGDERDCVVWLNGCTGFVVEDDLLVTAKHCRHPQTIPVTIQGRSVEAERLVTYDGKDGPVVFHLPDGPYESLPIASAKPSTGDRVYTLGYPGGNWSRTEGRVVGGDGVDVNYVAMRINPGNSGGPLLNERGEVLGVALHVDGNLGVNESGFSGWTPTIQAIEQAKEQRAYVRDKRRVVVLSMVGCGPCAVLRRDVTAGKFPGYQFEWTTYDPRLGTWDKPELHAEFVAECRPTAGLKAPTIWIPGTGKYREGYETSGPVLTWLSGVFKALFGIRDPKIPSVPQPQEEPEPTPASDPALVAELDRVKQQLAETLEIAQTTARHVKTFEDGGVLTKVQGISVLKEDKRRLQEAVDKLRADVVALRDVDVSSAVDRVVRSRTQGTPWGWLWAISGGIVTASVQSWAERRLKGVAS